jgi:radical SAM superfamily enzyme YgiQ (UPF0313 family)
MVVVRLLLVSVYDLGRQPFGLASPAALLSADGHEVDCVDLSLDPLPEDAVRKAGGIAFHLPMHTASRLAIPFLDQIRSINPRARLCAYGLYAPLNADYLRELGIETLIGGEFENRLREWANGSAPAEMISLGRAEFATPDRSRLPPLHRYAKLIRGGGEGHVTGYTEASRGCKHRCRHCPVVPVYGGQFRVVSADVVLRDIEQQVEAGARHITFGDPDFFNGPAHARRIVTWLRKSFPSLTYDVTIKVQHLLQHQALLPVLAETGCVLITSAVESFDDTTLALLEKGHTRADVARAVRLTRQNSLTLTPTFIPFTPWTTPAAYLDLFRTLAEWDMVMAVPPVQLALRLLVPAGSRLMDLDEMKRHVTGFDRQSLTWRWAHPDPLMDELAQAAFQLVAAAQKLGEDRARIFARLWELAARAAGDKGPPDNFHLLPRAVVPYLNEPWYC